MSEKHTVLRTIRISENIDQTLIREAKERSVSVNTLINTILTRYASWDRVAEKMRNVSLSSSQIKILFELSSEEAIEKLSEAAADRFTDLTKFVVGTFDLKSVLAVFGTIGRNSGLWSLEEKFQDDTLYMFFYHDFGTSFSRYLAKGIEITLSRLGEPLPVMEFNEHTVTTKIFLSESAIRRADKSDIFGQVEKNDVGRTRADRSK